MDPVQVPDPQLQQAYRQTRYVVRPPTPAAPITLQVDGPCPQLDAWLTAHGFDCAAFITAYNPRSQALAAAENQTRMQALQAMLQAQELTWLPGEGVPDQPGWQAEPSLLVPGLAETAACELAEQFEQYAVVHHRRHHTSRLLWTRIATQA